MPNLTNPQNSNYLSPRNIATQQEGEHIRDTWEGWTVHASQACHMNKWCQDAFAEPHKPSHSKKRISEGRSKKLNFPHQVYSVIFISWRNRFYILKIYFDSSKFWYYNAYCHSWKEEKHLSDSPSLRGKKENYQRSTVFDDWTYYVGFKVPSWTQRLVIDSEKDFFVGWYTEGVFHSVSSWQHCHFSLRS